MNPQASVRASFCHGYVDGEIESNILMMNFLEDQESVNPNISGRPPPGGSKRRLSLTPSRQQPKRKAKDRRRVSFAPDTELTSVHHFIKDDELSGGSTAADKYSIPEIPQAAWETEDLGHPHLSTAVPSSPDEGDMEITSNETWKEQMRLDHTGAVTAEVGNLQQLLEEETDEGASGALDLVDQESNEPSAAQPLDSITGAVPRLRDLLEEDEQALEQVSMPSNGIDRHGSSAQNERDGDPVGLTSDQTIASPRSEPSMMMLPSDEDSGTLGAPQQSKWGFNPGCEDTLDFNLELHGRMMMGDTTHGHLFGDTTGDAADSDTDSPNMHQGEEAGTHESAGGVTDAKPGSELMHMEGQEAPLQPGEGSAPKWTAPAFLPPYLSSDPPQPSGATGPENEAAIPGEQQEEQANQNHPALVMDTTSYSEMTQSTMDTRRDSFFSAPRRLSINSGSPDNSPARQQGSLRPTQGAFDGHRFSPSVQSPARGSLDPAFASPLDSDAGPSVMHAALRRSSNASVLGRDRTEALLADDTFSSPLGQHYSQEQARGDPLAETLGAVMDTVGVTSEQKQVPTSYKYNQQQEDEHPHADDGMHIPGGAGPSSREESSPCPETNMTALLLMGTPSRHASSSATAGLEKNVISGLTTNLLRTGGTTKMLAVSPQPVLSGNQTKPQQGMTMTAQLLIDEDDNVSFTSPRNGNGVFEAPPQLFEGVVANDRVTTMTPHSSARAFPGGPRIPRTPVNNSVSSASKNAAILHPPGSLPPRAPPFFSIKHSSSSSHALARITEGTGGEGLEVTAPPKLALGLAPSGNVAATAIPTTMTTTPGGKRWPVQSQSAITPKFSATKKMMMMVNTNNDQASSRQQGLPSSNFDLLAGLNQLPSVPRLGGNVSPGLLHRHLLPIHASGSPMVLSSIRGGQQGVLLQNNGAATPPAALMNGAAQPLPGTPQLTFQDFARVMELRFLDNLRRGTSINYADLAPNPHPRSLKECYKLLALTAPVAAELSQGVRTLSSEVEERRSAAAAAEVAAGRANPRALREAAAGRGVERLRSETDLLRRVCRTKASAVLKDVRVQMEESQAARLARAAKALRADVGFIADMRSKVSELRIDAEKSALEAREHLAKRQEFAQREKARADRRESLVALQARVVETRRKLEEIGGSLVRKEMEYEELQQTRAALGNVVQTDRMAASVENAQMSEHSGIHAEEEEAVTEEGQAKLEGLMALQAITGVRLSTLAIPNINSDSSLEKQQIIAVGGGVIMGAHAATAAPIPSHSSWPIALRVGEEYLVTYANDAFIVSTADQLIQHGSMAMKFGSMRHQLVWAIARACLGGLAEPSNGASALNNSGLSSNNTQQILRIPCQSAAMNGARHAICQVMLRALRQADTICRAISAARAAAPHLAEVKVGSLDSTAMTQEVSSLCNDTVGDITAALLFVHSAAGVRLKLTLVFTGIHPCVTAQVKNIHTMSVQQQRQDLLAAALKDNVLCNAETNTTLIDLVLQVEDALESVKRDAASDGQLQHVGGSSFQTASNPLYAVSIVPGLV